MRIYRALGIRRIVLANELVEPDSIRWLAAELAADPGFEVYCLVDSVAAVARMEAALGGSAARRIPVLVELGMIGGRTGARTIATALEAANAVLRSPVLKLAGVEGFEGIIEDVGPIEAFLSEVRALVTALAKEGQLADLDEVIVTAGGSEAFDLVVRQLGGKLAGLPTKLVLRSGCYVTHDDGVYDRLSPFGSRRGQGTERFRPALEAWGAVLSRPEPTLALASLGRRDVPFDSGYPVPLHVRGGSGLRGVRGAMEVTGLNDQHAFIRLSADDPLAVGDLIGCGISHPCTAFDKWRLIPVVDDGYKVIDAYHTLF
jgi:D-serine deaminase-like pyridoxal phosphate-dependent protein